MNNRKILTLTVDAKIHRELAAIKDSTGTPISQTAEAALSTGMKKKIYAKVSRDRAAIDARGGSMLEYPSIFNGREVVLESQLGSLAGIEAASHEFHKALNRSATDLRRGEEGLKLCNKALMSIVQELKSRV